jgi:heptosyltransferase-2
MNILVVAPAWIGDMVMTDTLLRVLRQQRDVHIQMLAPPATIEIARRLHGVERAHTLDAGHGSVALAERLRVGRELRAERFDQAIILPNSFKSALVPFFARIPRRTGWLGEQRFGLLNDWRRLDTTRYRLQIERFMALGIPPEAPLAKPYPEPRLEVDPDRARDVAQSLGLSTRAPVTVLCPGAEFGPAKRWPAEHFVSVAQHLTSRGEAVWLMGGPADVAVCEDIQRRTGHPGVAMLAGRTRIGEAIDLMALATRVICNDSGLMHVAAAVGVPVIAIYGSTSPDFTPPLSSLAKVVRLGLPCSPCFERECPLGHLDCLRTLQPDRVIAAS